MVEGAGPVRSSAMEREIFALWAPEPAKEPSLACASGRGQEVAKLPSAQPALDLRREPQGPALVASGKASTHASCLGASRDSSPVDAGA